MKTIKNDKKLGFITGNEDDLLRVFEETQIGKNTIKINFQKSLLCFKEYEKDLFSLNDKFTTTRLNNEEIKNIKFNEINFFHYMIKDFIDYCIENDKELIIYFPEVFLGQKKQKYLFNYIYNKWITKHFRLTIISNSDIGFHLLRVKIKQQKILTDEIFVLFYHFHHTTITEIIKIDNEGRLYWPDDLFQEGTNLLFELL